MGIASPSILLLSTYFCDDYLGPDLVPILLSGDLFYQLLVQGCVPDYSAFGNKTRI